MVSGIRFMGCSGVMGNTQATLYANGQATPRAEIFNLEAGATNSPNRLGFFGTGGAPSSPVIVGTYQSRSHITDHVGSNLGHLINVKYTGSSTAEVSGVSLTVTGHTLATIPQASGTLLVRFTEPNATAVTTQNGVFRAIDLTAASGAPNTADLVTGVTVQAAQLQDTAGNAGDSSWTNLGSSDLSLANQSLSQAVHDFHIIVSASPTAAGRKIDFAFYVELEFL